MNQIIKTFAVQQHFLKAVVGSFVVMGLVACATGPARQAEPLYNIDLSQWNITLPDGSSRTTAWLLSGNTAEDWLYYTDEGALVFRSPNIGGTTPNSRFTRSELRGMIMGVNSRGNTRGLTPNNWVFSTSSPEVKAKVGGVDGTLRATLQVDHVSTTGPDREVGRVIIGQIHASDDEPLRLYYRKLPGNTKGSIYFAHELPGGDDTWFEMIGSRSNRAVDPADGIALGERFSYEVVSRGLELTVIIRRDGKPDVSKTITMDSGYNDDWMYFKAGVYNQNRHDDTPDQSDHVQATFYAIDVTHP